MISKQRPVVFSQTASDSQTVTNQERARMVTNQERVEKLALKLYEAIRSEVTDTNLVPTDFVHNLAYSKAKEVTQTVAAEAGVDVTEFFA